MTCVIFVSVDLSVDGLLSRVCMCMCVFVCDYNLYIQGQSYVYIRVGEGGVVGRTMRRRPINKYLATVERIYIYTARRACLAAVTVIIIINEHLFKNRGDDDNGDGDSF